MTFEKIRSGPFSSKEDAGSTPELMSYNYFSQMFKLVDEINTV